VCTRAWCVRACGVCVHVQARARVHAHMCGACGCGVCARVHTLWCVRAVCVCVRGVRVCGVCVRVCVRVCGLCVCACVSSTRPTFAAFCY